MKDFLSSFVSLLANTPPSKQGVYSHLMRLSKNIFVNIFNCVYYHTTTRLISFVALLCSLTLSAETITNGTYSVRTIDGAKSTWDFTILSNSNDIKVTEDTYDNGIYFSPKTLKISSGNYLSSNGGSTVALEVPSVSAAGTIELVINGSGSNNRWFQLYINNQEGTDAQKLWSSYSETSTGAKGPQSFVFTSSDISTIEGKYYLVFKDNSAEMKVDKFTITLTSGLYESSSGGDGGDEEDPDPNPGDGDTPTELVSISEQTTWNFNGAASEDVIPTSNDWIVLSDASKNWNENFAAKSLAGQGSTSEYFYRSNNNCYQAAQLKFVTTVAGKVDVEFSDTGDNPATGETSRKPRHLFINNTDTKVSSNISKEHQTATLEIPAGEVIISSMIEDDNGNPSSQTTVRIYNVTFTPTTGGENPDIDPTPTGDEKYYYFAADVDTDGTLKKDATNTVKFLKADAQGKLSNISNDEVSMTTAMSSASWYYYSNSLEDADLSNSANWKSSSATGRYIRGLKMGNGTNYTLKLGNKTATSIKFYGYSNGTSKTLTIGEVSSGTTFAAKSQFGSYEFTKQGGFTGNVTISQDGDFYGILVITCGNTPTPDPDDTQYTVTLDPNGGTCDPTEMIYTGTPLELPEPVWEDHTFLGWFTESDTQAENPYTPTSDITLYAHWQQTAGSEEPDPAESCFDMTVKASAYGTKTSSGTTDITEYFNTNSGGILSFYCSGGRNIIEGQGLQFNSNNDYLICTLPAGKLLSGNSVIKIVMHGGTSKNRGFTISETEETQLFSETGKLGTLIYTDNWKLDGQNSFTLKYTGSVYLYSIVVEDCADEAHTLVETVSLTPDKETVYEGCPVTITATATPAATEYKWEIDGEEQSGETGATLTFIPDVADTYEVTCKARNQYNDAEVWIEGKIQVEVLSLCGEQLIKVSVSGGKAGTIEGVVGGTADVDLSSSNKLDKNKFLGITLAYGSFKEGDRVNINTISPVAGLGRIALYADKAMNTTVYEGDDCGILGDNLITLPAAAEGLKSLWIARNDDINNWNPTINFVSVERLCGPYVSIVSTKPQIGCDGVELSFKIYNAQDDITYIQWSLNGEVIASDATTYTYQATVAGTYSVEVTLTDGTTVTASLTLTAESVVEALVPKLTYQFAAMRGTENNEEGAIDNNKNRPYTSDDKYPLFSVAPAADGKNSWTATVEIHKKDQNGEVCYTSASTTYPWIEEYEPAENDTITLVANYAALREYILNDSQWQIQEGEAQTNDCDNHILRTGDTIMVKVAVEDCPVSERQVPIVISDKYSLAYIIRGEVDGDFYNDIYAPDTNDKFYQTLSEQYEVTQVNAYAPFRKLNYAPFDIVVLSDYPKATGSDTDADLMNRRYPTQVGALAQLVDYKPLFSLKGFLSALPQWKELGLTGNPRAPETVKEMTVLCEHRVLGTSGSAETGDRKIEMLYGGADNKGLQGFLVEGLQNFIPIAVIDTIDDNEQTVEGALIACCERQIKTEARMIILSIYSGAMDQLTDDGRDAIYEIVDYLLDARPAKVEDCAYIFNGGSEGNNTSWQDPQNWATGSVPQSYNTIRIEAPCEIDANVEAVSVRINSTNGSLTIAPNGALKVTDKFYMYDGADHYDKLLAVTDPDLITIKADATGNGMLIHTHNDAHPLYATVQLYSAAYYESGYTSESTATKYWTYFGVPVKEVKIPENFLYAYTYLWSESEGWIRKADDALEPFYGYALSQENATTFELKGQLASTDSVAIKLTKTSIDQGGMDGMNLVGNSWTAPIHISQMTKADFGDADRTIYIYQTGRDPEDGPTVSDKGSDGCWLAIPVDASAVIAAEADEYDIPTVIPAMQAFEINTPQNTELHLVYDRIVRNPLTEQYNNAPRRVAANRNNPLLMRIRVEDSNTAATLYLLEDESFTEGFDNGWDGRYMGNDGRTAGLWAYSEAGDMSVMAQPKIDGTTLGFKAGRESDYTFSFKWNGSPLWLNDIMLQRSVAIETGNTYTFRASDTDPANRFCISSEPYSGGTETSLSDIVLTDGVLSVNNPTGERLTLSVYDATGRLCSRTISTDHLLTTDITDVCQGVYMISVEGENTNIVKKVIR